MTRDSGLPAADFISLLNRFVIYDEDTLHSSLQEAPVEDRSLYVGKHKQLVTKEKTGYRSLKETFIEMHTLTGYEFDYFLAWCRGKLPVLTKM